MSVSRVSLPTTPHELTTDEPRRDTRDAAAQSPLRMAIVGCGAVSQYIHLPALTGLPDVRITALVDPNTERLETLAARLTSPVHAAPSTSGLERHADAAIVAAPNHLHAPIAIDLLERGLHVFVEKPLAPSLDEAQRIVDVARHVDRVLGVGVIRRQYLSFEFVQRLLNAGWLGRIRSFDFREGVVSAWPTNTVSPFRRDHGGGVLLDVGTHALDMLLGWLGPFESVKYRDDARGGVEANCLLELTLRNGATGVIELSRTRDLRNTCILRGERGEAEIGIQPNGAVTLRLDALEVSGVPNDGHAHDMDIHAADRRQFASFARTVRAQLEPDVSAPRLEPLLEPLRLFDACRGRRDPLDLPWERFEADIDWTAFAGKRVLVLGGSGFIGGRVVAALAQNSTASIRVLARDLSRVAGIARYPVELVRGDVGDRAALARAVEGCDFIVNCTYGKGDRREQARINVDAVNHLIQLAHAHQVQRVVHVSTMLVYGTVKSGVLDERTRSRAPRVEVYGYTKCQGEEAALREAGRLGVSIVVLQPTTVYGPGAPSWTVNPLRGMKSARLVLVNGGGGISNAVYVDDVVTALLQAALAPAAGGERMLISGPGVVTWREFLGAYDELLGGGRTVALDATALAQARRAEKKRRGNFEQLWALIREEDRARRRLLALPALRGARNAVRRLIPRRLAGSLKTRRAASFAAIRNDAPPADPIRLPSQWEEEFLSATATVDCAKAAWLIGYAPRYSLPDGMQRVAAWARWANML